MQDDEKKTPTVGAVELLFHIFTVNPMASFAESLDLLFHQPPTAF